METKNNIHNKQVSLSENQIVLLKQCMRKALRVEENDQVGLALAIHEVEHALGIDERSLRLFELKNCADIYSSLKEEGE